MSILIEYVISVIPMTIETIIKKQQKNFIVQGYAYLLLRSGSTKAVRGEVNSQMGQLTQ